MLLLKDHELLNAYKKAVEMNLEEDFLNLLATELNRRKIEFLQKPRGVSLTSK
ncbi:sporulation histidine kinase inhibitor Sda [Mesobacillus maritimus]|uniref:sporulation histidine kinase inhibitor Sda n=1 Tax=Mesobacillus maritimus TaxID=1643336 RepID=UPI00203D3A09|nr:sporulation histidine kinase inhibitor Sda [Mesobacillus maritimus]MCM3585370.1 sporulation histidine kinase inhibitor Sda [Mesobacillus maritimus]MCM3668252.1 sporulation histidine kinase inhibitor Sda [Mesobacillus maritimus]